MGGVLSRLCGCFVLLYWRHVLLALFVRLCIDETTVTLRCAGRWLKSNTAVGGFRTAAGCDVLAGQRCHVDW